MSASGGGISVFMTEKVSSADLRKILLSNTTNGHGTSGMCAHQQTSPTPCICIASAHRLQVVSAPASPRSCVLTNRLARNTKQPPLDTWRPRVNGIQLKALQSV